MLIQCDAAQLEWRVAVELSKDPVGIRELNDPTVDTHNNNQVELALPSRLIAKIFLFRTIYKGNGWSFAHDPNFSHVSTDPAYWDERNERFYKKYAGLNRTHLLWGQSVAANQPISVFTGREWWIGTKRNPRSGAIELPWTQLTNYPVQGTGHDLMAVARTSLRSRLQANKALEPVKLVSTVHDSIVCDSPNELVPEVAKLMHEVFRDIPLNVKKLFKRDLSVPFPCETKFGPNLRDMEKLQITL